MAPAILLEEQVEVSPFDQFCKWLDEAVAAGLKEPNVFTLSTVSKDGKPSSRMIHLKEVQNDGFVWFTKYNSRKGNELAENPNAALLFYWGDLKRQVRVEGRVEKIPEEESEQCFQKCPRGVQIGAVASHQSSVVPGKQYLEDMYKQSEEQFSDGSVIPKPKSWGGYRLIPESLEFWQGQPTRLHDRLRYTLVEVEGKQAWKIDRLAP